MRNLRMSVLLPHFNRLPREEFPAMSVPKVASEFVTANESYAKSYGGQLPLPPSRQVSLPKTYFLYTHKSAIAP